MQLLEYEGADCHIEIPAGPAEGVSEMRGELGDGQMLH
jgi:hypothetical protein